MQAVHNRARLVLVPVDPSLSFCLQGKRSIMIVCFGLMEDSGLDLQILHIKENSFTTVNNERATSNLSQQSSSQEKSWPRRLEAHDKDILHPP